MEAARWIILKRDWLILSHSTVYHGDACVKKVPQLLYFSVSRKL